MSHRTILHLITGLNMGGAEMALHNLLAALPAEERQHHRVVSLIPAGPVGPMIEKLGVSVVSLHMNPGKPTPAALWRALKLVAQTPGWFLQGWMYHGNLLATVICLLLLRPRRHIWCVHNSLAQMENERPMTRLIIDISAWFSWLPRKIVYVAKRSAAQHEALGYAASRTMVIPNGCDVQRFMPDDSAKARMHQMLGLAPEVPLVAVVGRWDWSKDHANFLKALMLTPEVHGVLIGKHCDDANPQLGALIQACGVKSRVHLLGLRTDVETLLPGMDLLCLPSRTEAMPTVVIEAMACGVPCVVTDVGDAAVMVGEVGWVVPPQNAPALAEALRLALASDIKERGKQARARVLALYTFEQMVCAYQALYREMEIS